MPPAIKKLLVIGLLFELEYIGEQTLITCPEHEVSSFKNGQTGELYANNEARNVAKNCVIL